ncbi:MAG: L,D-transpeptidase [Myxococcales bacterium]|nr:MAG: L,D-transpeptidase [Myxococcales bacterium]
MRPTGATTGAMNRRTFGVPGRCLSLLAAALLACSSREAPPGEGPPTQVTVGALPASSNAPATATLAANPGAAPARSGGAQTGMPAAAPTTMLVTGGYAQVFLGPVATKGTQLGYLKRGGRVQADATPVAGAGCSEGWVKLEPLGYVCSRHVTADLNNSQGKAREPALDEILPYRYASNVAHGTPLYRSVPSRDEMARYEPYLHIEPSSKEAAPSAPAADTASASAEPRKTASTKRKKKKKRGKKDRDAEAQAAADQAADDSKPAEPLSAPSFGVVAPTEATAAAPATAAPAAPAVTATATAAATVAAEVPVDGPDAGAPAVADLDGGTDAAVDDSTKPWWLRRYETGKGPEVKLSDLTEGSDKVMARRMVRGFYVAIDHTFFAGNRGWHKTTAGLLAPADRFSVVKPNEFHGAEIDEAHAAHAVAFVLAKQATTYTLDADGKTLKPAGGLKRYDRTFLTGQKATVGGKNLRETVDNVWLREGDIAYTAPGARPSGVGDHERWIDVNLSRQTLVAMEGDRPVFATLVSTGRKGGDKAHDHQTPTGSWRMREKHVAATMDGDGAASGDMPYSIEDVPYVQYFEGSYALHGAFWHDNFGRQQSHGCVNLAPLDAKRLFFWADPQIPKGWYGMNSQPDVPGSLVVVHE